MDFIRDYESDSSSSEGTEYADSCKPANPNDKIDVPSVRKLYLIIYSQADVGRFPPRQSFVEAVLYSFYDTPDKIMHWSCCMEEHPESGGSYFQMALKLNRNKRWLSSKRFLLERCGISVHFSDIHRNYFSAWKYVTKQDKEFVESPDTRISVMGSLTLRRHRLPTNHIQPEVRARNRFVMTLQIAIKKAAKVAGRKIT